MLFLKRHQFLVNRLSATGVKSVNLDVLPLLFVLCFFVSSKAQSANSESRGAIPDGPVPTMERRANLATQIGVSLAIYDVLERFNGTTLAVDDGKIVNRNAFGVVNTSWKVAEVPQLIRERRIESTIDILGYQLGGLGRLSEALPKEKLIPQAFPRLSSTSDSLHERHLEDRNREPNVESYRKALDQTRLTVKAMLEKFEPKNSSGGLQSVPVKTANPLEVSISLDLLKERSEYAVLDKQSVEAIARLAEVRWANELSGFDYKRVEHFSTGGVAHWMSIWSHRKTGLEFVIVPGGTFQMGSPENEPSHREDELQHWVTLDPFLISRTECTRGAWSKLARAASLRGAPFDGAEQLPVSGIGPVDVEIWCREALLNFPTEAQWEFMCRAGTTSAWAMGPNKNDLIRFANLGSAECPEDWIRMTGITEPWHDGYGNETANVATFECNSFGLYDVHGNLNEWCRDYYFSYEVQVEKGTGLRPGISNDRLARGGNFGGDATAARSAKRLTCGPGITPNGGGNNGFGFRPSLDLPF